MAFNKVFKPSEEDNVPQLYKRNKIWLSSPHMGGSELAYIEEAFFTNWIAPLGPHVDAFERDIENYLGKNMHVGAFSSGTASLHLALILLGIGPGDEVICQSMTFSASANPIVYQGATPVFIDSESSTWNLSPELLETAIVDRIKKGKKPKAIICVHLYGMPAQMEKIMNISSKYEIPLIEDAAEALGSSYKNQKAGTFGDLNILSFNGNKIITTSSGGALVASDQEAIKKARFLSTQARDPAPHYQHSQIGYNYRMSNVCAGIGRGQMKVLDDRVKKRRNNFIYYKNEIGHLYSIKFQSEPDQDYYSNHWLTAVLFEDYDLRERVRLHLESLNIESRPLWKPMHLQPVFSQFPFYGNGISEKLFQNGLCLPSGSNLTDEDLQNVVSGIIFSML